MMLRMSLGRTISSINTLATLLLALLSCQSHAGAANCLQGVKCLFGGRSSYVKFAETLFEATFYPQFEENAKIAKNIMGEYRLKNERSEYTDLVWHFATIYGGDDEERLCQSVNLESLRFLADAMRRDGNLSPKQATEPTRRLNRIIISLVEKAHTSCIKRLEARWPKPWTPQLSSEKVLHRLSKIIDLPNSYIFAGYIASGSPRDQEDLSHKLSDIIDKDLAEDGIKRELDEMQVTRGHNKEELLKQLDDYVYKPCQEFLALPEAGSVLGPYANLVIASFVIKPNLTSMNKFYQDPAERSHLHWVETNKDVLGMVYRYQACSALQGEDRNHLANLIKRARRGPIVPTLPEICSDGLF